MDDAQLFATLYPALRRFAAAVTSLAVDPDDLVQDVLTSVLRRGSLTDLDDPLPYLRRAVVNRARNDHRDRTRRAAILDANPVDGTHRDTYPSDFTDLSTLSVDQRAVLFLRFVENRATDEIADLLGLTPDAVRARASRAIRALRLELDQRSTAE